MTISIQDFSSDYVEAQVELGTRILSDWKYQNQSSVEHLKRVYDREDFNPRYRIYALEDGELVGFQTSNLQEEDTGRMVGRMEFPISDSAEAIQLLQKESEKRLIDDGASLLRVRVSPHWGRTEELAGTFGFVFEKPHLMTSTIELAKLKTIDLDYVLFAIGEGQGKEYFREVFPQRFPMRYEGEVDEWYKYYRDQEPVVWNVLIENNSPQGHIIGFKREGKLAVTALFSLGKDPEDKLQALLSKAVETGQRRDDLEELVLSIGDNQVKYADSLNQLGLNLRTQVSYYTKKA